MSRSTLQELRVLAVIVAASATAGAVYAVATTDEDGSPWPLRALVGAAIGTVIASCLIGFELISARRLAARGRRVLVNLLSGRHHRPREEQRIVLFLDLVGSTAIAEQTGNVGFHALLSNAFTRLSRVVTDFGGEVNTAARIEQACRSTGHELLASKPPLDRAALPAGVVARSIGSHALRGKNEPLELFALERRLP